MYPANTGRQEKREEGREKKNHIRKTRTERKRGKKGHANDADLLLYQ